jgi:diacylglycerol kinase family enzyme
MIPYGISHDLVRAFGEGMTARFRNISLQIASSAIPTDLISCGSSFAINFCTIGIESALIKQALETYNAVSRRTGVFHGINSLIYQILFYVESVKALMNPAIRNQFYSITIDGEDLSGYYGSINIANGPCYGGDKSAVTAAMPNDGLLDVLFIKSETFWQSLGGITDYLKGLYYKHPAQFAYKRARKIAISSETPILVNLDGEVFFDTNITIELVSHAVNFVAVNGLNYKKRADLHE